MPGGGGAVKETENKELEALRNQSAEIAELLSSGKDTVEISDEARALSEAAHTAKAAPESSTLNIDAPERTLDTREDRETVAQDYNAVLEDLRDTYGEEEAMRRFDAFMESEGYERVTDPSRHTSIGSFGIPSLANEHGYAFSNLTTRSSISGAMSNGEVEYLASTHAYYDADMNQEIRDVLAGVYQKNLESAQSGTSINLAEYMRNNFGSGVATSAVSASTDLGAVAANLMKEAGLEFGETGKVSFSLRADGSGLDITSGVQDYEAAQKAIDAALARNPDMLQAFKDEYSSVALTDTSNLAGAYSDGERSVAYEAARRSFTYSASEPAAVVMTDHIGVESSGYDYKKKVSDSFVTDADFHLVNDGGVNIASMDFADHQAINEQMNKDIRKAIETGEAIDSTLSQEEYDAVQKARGTYDPFGGVEAKLYSAASPEAEQKEKAARTRQALLDLESDPRFRDREIPYMDEQREARQATASRLLELFNPARKTPGLTMINSIMDFLRLG